jgi:tetratricopeptide (TPR) repeat protein
VRLPVACAAAVVALLAACDVPKSDVDPAVAAAAAKTRAKHPELFRRKIVLLGFDSCDPDLVEQFVREGKLPHFAQLRRDGAHGALASLQPTLSPVVWTTIATGMPPQRHGILDFVTDTPSGRVPVTSRMRQADAVWDLLSGQGEKVGVVGWLVTWPAEKVNGFLVSERMGRLAYDYLFGERTYDEHRTWPEDLAARLKDDVAGPEDVPIGKMRPFVDITEEEYRSSSSTTFDPRNRVGNLRIILSTAQTFRSVGERLLAEEKPRFFACYFEAMDAICHLFMPFAPPKTPNVPTDLYMKYRNAIEADYIWHDRVLGEYMAAADADTTILVVSDHGFKSGDFRTADESDFHAKTGAMWHRHYGVFFAWGNGVKRGATVAGASVYDIAPTVLASMGYPVPEDMPGKVLDAAFEEPLPVETVKTYRGEARRDEVAKDRTLEGEEKARSPEAEDELKKLESLGYISNDRSDAANGNLNLVTAHMAQGRYEAAYQELKKLYDGGVRGPRVLGPLATCCLRTDRLGECDKYVAEALAADPHDISSMIARTLALIQRRKFAEAETSARETIAVKNDTPQCWATLATVLQGRASEAEDKGDDAAANDFRRQMIDAYEGALRLEPRQPEWLFELARTRLSLRRIGEADVEKSKDELDRVLEMNPNHVQALNNRAVALMQLGLDAQRAGRAEDADRELSEALADTEKAIAVAAQHFGPDYPGYDKGWANKAYVLWLMGRLDLAAAAAAQTRKIDPAYAFRPVFVSAMAKANRPIPPPAQKQQ